MTDSQSPKDGLTESPEWSSTTKIVVGLSLAALFGAMLVQFRQMIGPLLLAIILAYLLHPAASYLAKKTRLSWRASVALVFFVVVILVLGIITLAGFALVQQIESLIGLLQRLFNQLPGILSDLTTRTYFIGPMKFDLAQFNLQGILDQWLNSFQSILGQVGGLVSALASRAVTVLGWLVFVLLVAYFLLSEGGQVRENIIHFGIPGYDVDMKRLGRELLKIWDAYLRSQLLIFVLVVITYYLIMTVLGMRFTFGIALLAGLARFVPYIGPFITWTIAALVAYFAPTEHFGLQPWAYALLVIGVAIVVDQIFDQYVQPRLMGSALGLHPAAIMVAALIAYQLLGIIGLVLAAPVLATVTLGTRYAVRKMFDLDPWLGQDRPARIRLPHDHYISRFRAWLRMVFHR